MPALKIVKSGEKQAFQFKSVFISAVFGVILAVGLLALAAWAFTFFTFDLKWIPTVSKVIMFFAAFIAGIIGGKGKKSSGYLYGALTGVCYLAILFLISAAGDNVPEFKFPLFLTIVLTIFTATIGGILGINIKTSKKRKRNA